MIYDKEYLAILKRSHPQSFAPYVLAIHPVAYIVFWMLIAIIAGVLI